MIDPTTLFLLHLVMGATGGAMVCVAVVAFVWAFDTVFKTTKSYLVILEWREAWIRENRPKAKIVSDGSPD